MQRRRLIHALAALALLLPVSFAHAQNTLQTIMAKKLITIAISTDFPPYGFVGPDLKPQGLDIDMANYIASKLGVKVELVPVTSANRIPYLQTKKADLVISNVGQKCRAREGDRLHVGVLAVLSGRVCAEEHGDQGAGRSGRQERSV